MTGALGQERVSGRLALLGHTAAAGSWWPPSSTGLQHISKVHGLAEVTPTPGRGRWPAVRSPRQASVRCSVWLPPSGWGRPDGSAPHIHLLPCSWRRHLPCPDPLYLGFEPLGSTWKVEERGAAFCWQHGKSGFCWPRWHKSPCPGIHIHEGAGGRSLTGLVSQLVSQSHPTDASNSCHTFSPP